MKVEIFKYFEVEEVDVRAMSRKDIARLFNLTNGEEGCLAYILKSYLEGDSQYFCDVKSFIVRDQEDIKGWAMTFNVGNDRAIQMFVDSNFRNSGIGTAIAHKAKTLYPDIIGQSRTAVYSRLDMWVYTKQVSYQIDIIYDIEERFGNIWKWFPEN